MRQEQEMLEGVCCGRLYVKKDRLMFLNVKLVKLQDIVSKHDFWRVSSLFSVCCFSQIGIQ